MPSKRIRKAVAAALICGFIRTNFCCPFKTTPHHTEIIFHACNRGNLVHLQCNETTPHSQNSN